MAVDTPKKARSGRLTATDLLIQVLLIGIDGASPKVAFPMMLEGRLPHLAGAPSESRPLGRRLGPGTQF